MKTKNPVRHLGVLIDSDLSFSNHTKAVTKTASYHLKQRVRDLMSRADLEKLIHAFISNRLENCKALLSGLPKKTIRQLQLIQNDAARVVTRTRTTEHITAVLRSLHWIPVIFRIDRSLIVSLQIN